MVDSRLCLGVLGSGNVRLARGNRGAICGKGAAVFGEEEGLGAIAPVCGALDRSCVLEQTRLECDAASRASTEFSEAAKKRKDDHCEVVRLEPWVFSSVREGMDSS